MFTLHIMPPLSYRGRSTDPLADILADSPRIHFSLPHHHADFTVVYLMQLQEAKNRRRQRTRNTLSCPMNLKKRS